MEILGNFILLCLFFDILMDCIHPSIECRNLHFQQPIEDKALDGHVIRSINTTSDDNCMMQCYSEERCVSYNIGPVKDDFHLCELSHSDHVLHQQDLADKKGFLYRAAQNNPCHKKPCEGLKNSICLAGFTDKGFKCQSDLRPACDLPAGQVCTKDLRLSDSEILKGHFDYKAKLREYLAPVQVSGKQWMLCFRASEHQYRAAAFHTACDNKGPTVTLIRVGIYVFGGYTDKSWVADAGGHYISSNAAFLFSLKNQVNHPQQYKMLADVSPRATYNHINFGPTFGYGYDLYVADNCNAYTASYTNLGHTYRAPNGYFYGASETRTLLAGSYNFKCDEYEVFYQV